MTDPRKPIHRPGPAAQNSVREIAHDHLLAVTEAGAKAIGCTGASFVILGLGIWVGELADLDPRSTRQLLDALSTIFDPQANPTKKAHAEKKRRAAVERLLAAVDLDMNPAAGSA